MLGTTYHEVAFALDGKCLRGRLASASMTMFKDRRCDSESDVTVSSLPKLGHMLVLCLRRIIMLWW